MQGEKEGLEKKLEQSLDIKDVCVGDYVRFSYPSGKVMATRIGYVSEVRNDCFFLTSFDMRNIRNHHFLADRYEMKNVRDYLLLVRDCKHMG